MELTVNRVEIIESKGERHAWYLTIVRIDNENACFWSHHRCNGMTDAQAKKAFEREHFNEIAVLVSQKMKNESPIIQLN